MKEMNSLEMQMRSWQPRRPSPGLKRRIFSATGPVRRAGMMAWSLPLVPAAACFLVALSALHQGALSSGGSRHSTIGLTDRNQWTSPAADYHQEHNDISALTFEWTNRGTSTSSISSFAPGKAN